MNIRTSSKIWVQTEAEFSTNSGKLIMVLSNHGCRLVLRYGYKMKLNFNILVIKSWNLFVFNVLLASQAVPDVSKANGNLLVDDRNKYRSMWIRAYSSIWMIGGFALIIYFGHLCITAMVVVIQIYMAKELFNLLRKAHEDRHLPGFRLLNWSEY